MHEGEQRAPGVGKALTLAKVAKEIVGAPKDAGSGHDEPVLVSPAEAAAILREFEQRAKESESQPGSASTGISVEKIVEGLRGK